jgi:diguanylate cyclase (GGDEF)-like protein/putative nucleotidyltransferase with HDIG domain
MIAPTTASSAVERRYAKAVMVSGAAVLVLRLPATRFDQPLLFWSLLIGSIVLSATKVRLPLARDHATLSLSYFTDFMSIALLGANQAMIVGGVSAITQSLILGRSQPSWYKTLFGAAALVVTIQVTGLAAAAFGGFRLDATPREFGTVTFAAAIVFFTVNSSLVAIAIALARRQAIVAVWYGEFFWTAPSCFAGAASAALLVHVAGAYVWAVLLAAAPLCVTLQAYRLYGGRLEEQQRRLQEVSDLHMASVEALARAIDARDQTIEHVRGGNNHIRRVQAWATALAEAAGIVDEIEAVKVAALLHDIGKLAVPEHILTKPGRLTAKEFARVRIHPIVGAEIIKAVPFPDGVASFIRSHHERWDGSGYPDGLRGEETPLGARVLAVVDCFDALTSSRPYHAAARRSDAIAMLRAEAGRALDPRLVDLFLEILPRLEAADQEERSQVALATAVGERSAPRTGLAEDHSPVAPGWVFDNISQATQEMRELYDLAQTLGTRLSVDDTMALLSGKLSRLIPGSAWILFLHEPDEDVLRCRFVTGLAADTIARMVIPGGGGPTGWAARHRTAVLNACAASDFDAAGLPMDERFQAALSFPLVDGEQLIGALTIYHVAKDPFSDEHRLLLEHVSSQVASVLRNTVAFERMRDVFLTDPLTSLPNSRALDEFLRSGPLDITNTSVTHAFVMIDIDEFKTVNDGHGHPIGDAALQAVARVIHAHVRNADFCARYGGDEFIVVLPGCDQAAGESRAADLQDAVSDLRLDTIGDPLRLGISVGVSAFPVDGLTIPTLIAVADRRMYLDKARRRHLIQGTLSG